MRYELRVFEGRWAVWDTVKNTPAVVNDVWQVDLEMEVADDLVDLLNHMDRTAGKEKPAG